MRISSSKKRSSKREDDRRKATYKIINDIADRNSITPNQLAEFVRGIEKNNTCQFGIVLLSELSLDVLYQNPKLPSEQSTLIRFAGKLRRDAIIASLLKGGADCTVFSCSCHNNDCNVNRNMDSSSSSSGVGSNNTNNDSSISSNGMNGANPLLSSHIRKQLSLLRKPLAVWIIRNMMQMRKLYLLRMDVSNKMKRQDLYWHEKKTELIDVNLEKHEEDNSTCEMCMYGENRNMNHSYVSLCKGRCSLLMAECNHIYCEACYWQYAVLWDSPGEDSDENGGEDICCPICKVNNNNLNAAMNVNTTTVQPYQSVSTTSPLPLLNNLSPEQIKDQATVLFNLLPEYLHKILNTGHDKKSKFTSMPRSALAKIQMGTYKGQRTEELFRAATIGQCLRLKALCEAGIDITAKNEYGQNALFLASMNGNRRTVALLISMGADVQTTDNAGVSVSDAAENSLVSIEVTHDIEQLIVAAATPIDSQCMPDDITQKISELHVGNKEINDNTIFNEINISKNKISITHLIPVDSDHIGAGSFYIDGAFDDCFLSRLERLFAMLPKAPMERGTGECASRFYYHDTKEWVRMAIAIALRNFHSMTIDDGERDVNDGEGKDMNNEYGEEEDVQISNSNNNSNDDNRNSNNNSKNRLSAALPHMRYLQYNALDASSPPHIDLSRRTSDGRTSSHTFLLYLNDCHTGGETRLLRCVNPKKIIDDDSSNDTGSNTENIDSNILATIAPRRGRLLVFPHCCPHEGLGAISLPKTLLRGEII